MAMANAQFHVTVIRLCGLVTFLAMGVALGFGSVYLDIMETFNTSRPLAALVPSLSTGTSFVLGIVTGPVVNRVKAEGVARALIIGRLLMMTGCIASFFVQSIYILFVTFCVFSGVFTGPLMNWMGEAKGMVVGSLLMTVGCIASTFAPSITVLLITFSCITGVGSSMSYLAANVVVGTVFYDNRHLVLPLLYMCGGLGSTAFPFLLRRLVDEYGLRGMFLIISGFSLQILLCGYIVSVFHPIKKVDKNVAPKEKVLMERENSAFNDDKHDEINTLTNNDRDLNGPRILTDESTLVSDHRTAHDNKRNVNSYGGYENNDGKSYGELANEPVSHIMTGSKEPEVFRRNIIKQKDKNSCPFNAGMVNSSKPTSDDNFQNDNEINMIKESSITTIAANEDVKAKRNPSFLTKTFQTHLFQNVRYVLTLLFLCTLYLTFLTPALFITEIAREAGLTIDQGTMLLLVIYLAGLVGRVVLVIIQGVFKLPPLYVQSSSIVGGAISILCFVLIGHVNTENVYAAYLGLTAVYGFVIGIVNSCIGMTCLELVETRHYAAALGNMFFVLGISGSLAGLLGGIVKDVTGSYNTVLYLGLAQGLLGGAVVTLIGLTLRTKHKQPDPRPLFVETEDRVTGL